MLPELARTLTFCGRALPAGAFALAFSFTSYCVGRLSPAVQMVDSIEVKLAHLSAEPDRYDTLFLGSSRVQMHIDPVAFDAAMAARGLPSRSFNFGVPGMFAPENGFVAEQIFALRLRGLRRVFLEYGPLVTDSAAGSKASARTIAWHDLRRTGLLCESLWLDADSAHRHEGKEKNPSRPWLSSNAKGVFPSMLNIAGTLVRVWPQISPHIGSLLAHETNLGRGASRMAELWEVAEEDLANRAPADGFKPWPVQVRPEVATEVARRVAGRLAKPVQEVQLDPASQENLRAIVRLIRNAGAEPIFYSSPNTLSTRRLPDPDLDVPIIDFTDVRRWADLFAPERWHDTLHLDEVGARLLTQHLAEEYLKLPLAPR